MAYDKINEELLLKIFHIPSPSNQESKMQDFITDFLDSLKIPYTKDKTGNIFNIDNENKPLLSAHMDTVQKESDCILAPFIRIYDYEMASDKEIISKRILRGLGVVGGDDKCGIYIILEILSKHKDINFIFSVGEEVGCTGIKAFAAIEENRKKLEKCSYGLVLDRRYSDNIICFKNSYGTQEFEDALFDQLKQFKFKPEAGAVSDANTLKEFMSCANLSVGYYEPHSIKEFVVLSQLKNTLNAVESTITTMVKRFKPNVVAPVVSSFRNSSYNKFTFKFDNFTKICSVCHISSFTTELLGKQICSYCLKELSSCIEDYYYPLSTKKKKKSWVSGYLDYE
jgi:hypothetical protein